MREISPRGLLVRNKSGLQTSTSHSLSSSK